MPQGVDPTGHRKPLLVEDKANGLTAPLSSCRRRRKPGDNPIQRPRKHFGLQTSNHDHLFFETRNKRYHLPLETFSNHTLRTWSHTVPPKSLFAANCRDQQAVILTEVILLRLQKPPTSIQNWNLQHPKLQPFGTLKLLKSSIKQTKHHEKKGFWNLLDPFGIFFPSIFQHVSTPVPGRFSEAQDTWPAALAELIRRDVPTALTGYSLAERPPNGEAIDEKQEQQMSNSKSWRNCFYTSSINSNYDDIITSFFLFFSKD